MTTKGRKRKYKVEGRKKNSQFRPNRKEIEKRISIRKKGSRRATRR